MSYYMTFSFGNFSLSKVIFMLIVCLVGFSVVHIIKMMRLYLVVMEQNISVKRFIPAYLRTTLVNLIIPFKLGEIYRVFDFSRVTGSVNVGFFSVLIDRFFDTLALVIILMPFQLLSGHGVDASVIVLTAFLLIVIFAYTMFPSSYRYLNRYIIMKKRSDRSMKALKMLEKLDDWYMYVRKLVTGRYGLMLLFSLGAWIFELFVIMAVANMCGLSFKMSDFGNYISSILSSGSGLVNKVYTVYSVIVIGIATIVFTIIYLTGKSEIQK